MKSKTQTETSTEAQDAPITDSVFDFLFHDGRRIASFLAQFDTLGHLTQTTQNATIQKETQGSSATDGQIGSAHVAKVSTTVSEMAKEGFVKTSQRIYDPTWANARYFLDYLDETNRINRDLSKARIGQFVLVSGSIAISDLQMLEKMWKLPSFKKMMITGATQGMQMPEIPRALRDNAAVLTAKKAAEAQLKNANNLLDLFFEMIAALPHTIQARLKGEASIWCSLAREGMSFDPSDIALKYGEDIPGTWHMLGVLDAVPATAAAPATPDWSDGQEMAVKMMQLIAPLTRNMLGRPSTSYGVTPLLIFREVEK